jgi:hypothetical protein
MAATIMTVKIRMEYDAIEENDDSDIKIDLECCGERYLLSSLCLRLLDDKDGDLMGSVIDNMRDEWFVLLLLFLDGLFVSLTLGQQQWRRLLISVFLCVMKGTWLSHHPECVLKTTGR